MSDFSDKEDRMLIQLVHQHNAAKGKKTSWIDIAAKMKTKKTPDQLRLRVACLKKRFGNILTNFPSWYFDNGRRLAPVIVVTTVRSSATRMAQSVGEPAAAPQLVQKVSYLNTVPKT